MERGASRPLSLFRREGGFTLTELLITAAIMAIIASIALPMYSRYTTQARQQDAKVQLTAIRQAQEIYKLQYNAYAASLANANFSWAVPQQASNGGPHRYAYTLPASTATTFTAQAVGNIDGDGTQDTWTINQDGTLTNTVNDVAG